MLSTRVISIGLGVMVQPWLEVVHICNMLNGGRGKEVPNLAIHTYMIIGTVSIKPLSHAIHLYDK